MHFYLMLLVLSLRIAMISFNKKLKPVNRKDLEAKFEEIKKEKKKMDKRRLGA